VVSRAAVHRLEGIITPDSLVRAASRQP
jgi:hypothetical protein